MLPLDAATSLGVVQCLASVLPSNALQAGTIQHCMSVLEFMEHFTKINVTLHPLGKRGGGEVDVVDNQMSSKQLQTVLRHAGISWTRQGIDGNGLGRCFVYLLLCRFGLEKIMGVCLRGRML